jgi:type 1 fimbriae regulatory protein FimE
MTAKVVTFTRAKAPTIVNRKIPPRRVPNAAVRGREYLTPDEVEGLIKAAKSIGRHGHRDAALILLAYRHGFRVSELIALRWDQIDLKQGLLHVNRLKNGTPSNHPIRGPEIRALRRLQREYPETPYVFVTERKGTAHPVNGP